jgi:ubiquinone/menaquinone biosynthesis C-methylase UbiE
MLEYFEYDYKLQMDEENIHLIYDLITEFNAKDHNHPVEPKKGFDLIVFSFGLHWINDVPNFLIKIKDLLNPEGIFIANFVGSNSLKSLRSQLIGVETQFSYPHSPHISPFIHFNHITPLLQQSGFKEIIVDYEDIELEYKSPFALMKEIQNIGESNSLIKTANYSISRAMLASLRNAPAPFYDKINLISFIASRNKNSLRLKR